MLKNDRSDLDYFQLLRKSRDDAPRVGLPLRVALLADVSTQHLVPILRTLFAGNGIDAEIYEADYDLIEIEAYNPGSGLYGFAPQLVVILQSVQKLKTAFYAFSGDRAQFAQARANTLEEVWHAILGRTNTRIVQSTFVLPCERPFGNFGLKMPDTLYGAVSELNREICVRARSCPSVLINDVDYLAAWTGRRAFVDERLWALSKSLCSMERLPDVAQNLVDIGVATCGRGVKCVVLDLDNTLWGGVLGDDGLEGIGLGDLDDGDAFRLFQLFLRDLSRRGIILAVCSKNNDSIARQVFREHPGMVLKEEDIAVFLANWDDKATNIRRIQETLNIGFDSMVFLDDNPFERNLVRELVPGVIVPELPDDPGQYVRTLSELNLFETDSRSELDASRGALYRDQATREEQRGRFAGIDEYLASLDTTAVVRPFRQGNLPRITQLIQRSNQFNLTTRRYSHAECEAMMRETETVFPFTVTLTDRFGDFGLVNIVILRRLADVLQIDAFLMSCRVLQRGVEQYAMNKIFEHARRVDCRLVSGRYIPTTKNAMVKDFFAQFGFTRSASSTGEGIEWTLPVEEYLPRRVHIRELAEVSRESGGTR